MGALLYKTRDKSLFFKDIAGYPGWRALGQAPANIFHVAPALDTDPKNLVREFAERVKDLRKPEVVDSGPVQDVILKGPEVDMTTLPAHIAGIKDGGQYITSGLVIARDPDTGVQNMSFHKMQIKRPNRLGILMVPRHLNLIYQKNETKNMPTPISVMIGHHPMYYFAAAHTGPFDLDELELAGALLKEEVEVIRCKNGFLVPACAEIMLWGRDYPP